MFSLPSSKQFSLFVFLLQQRLSSTKCFPFRSCSQGKGEGKSKGKKGLRCDWGKACKCRWSTYSLEFSGKKKVSYSHPQFLYSLCLFANHSKPIHHKMLPTHPHISLFQVLRWRRRWRLAILSPLICPKATIFARHCCSTSSDLKMQLMSYLNFGWLILHVVTIGWSFH